MGKKQKVVKPQPTPPANNVTPPADLLESLNQQTGLSNRIFTDMAHLQEDLQKFAEITNNINFALCKKLEIIKKAEQPPTETK